MHIYLENLKGMLGDDCSLSDYNSSEYPITCNVSHTFLAELLANITLRLDRHHYPEYYSYQYRLIGTLFQSIIFVVGVLGNVLVVLVVFRTPSMHSPTYCYLVSLAVADCLVLVAAVPQEIVSYYLVGDEWIWGRVGCALLIFIQYTGINASSLSITAFTVERYIAICHPMHAHAVCTVRRAKRIICCVWIFALCYCSPWLVLTKTIPLMYEGIPVKEKCTFALSRNSYVGYYFADLIVFYVIPLLLSCVLYGIMARILYDNAISSAKNPGGQQMRHLHRGDTHRFVGNGTNATKPNIQSSATQVVKMLVTVVALFAAFWFPYRVWLVYNSFAKEPYMELWFLMFAKTMVFINRTNFMESGFIVFNLHQMPNKIM
uniref:Thyrotropin-releasing hormone receptor n=1 Tax=Strigamia maritima TaxID=126957 RepID=T1IRY8_STRMM